MAINTFNVRAIKLVPKRISHAKLSLKMKRVQLGGGRGSAAREAGPLVYRDEHLKKENTRDRICHRNRYQKHQTVQILSASYYVFQWTRKISMQPLHETPMKREMVGGRERVSERASERDRDRDRYRQTESLIISFAQFSTIISVSSKRAVLFWTSWRFQYISVKNNYKTR